ncbi:MAG TPA: DUF5715 family protein [Streptosporangiaceae bacterium]|jgi:hypothetical protein
MHAHGGAPRTGPDLARYRDAVADLLIEIAGLTGPEDLAKAEKVLTERLADAEFATVLAASPEGRPAAIDRLLREVRHYQPGARNCAADLVAHIRIHLFALIDVMWWGSAPAFVTDSDLLRSAELADLEPLRRRGELHFRYRRQARTLPARALRAADRRLRPEHTPRTAGLRFARARRESVTLLNQLAAEFAAAAPGTPPLWVTSLARSIEQQRRLRALGYTATLPSAHCVGYAMDVEMSWFRRFGAAATLEGLLREREQAGQVNAIDEGQTWHLCLSPAAVAGNERSGEGGR